MIMPTDSITKTICLMKNKKVIPNNKNKNILAIEFVISNEFGFFNVM